MRLTNIVVSLAGVGVFGSACAQTYPPPRDLVNARSAYARASAGPAQTLSTARLKLAKQSLSGAEMAYGATTEEEVRDRAYVALRQVEAAEAEASTALAGQRREQALRQLASMGGERAAQARAQLEAAEQKASEEGHRADSAEQQASAEKSRAQAESERAQGAQRQADEANVRLSAEQQARAEAESRARQAMADLERMGNVRRDARGIVVTLSGQVLFATNRSTLLPAAESSLDGVSAALKALPPDAPPVIIEGHTDSTGARGFNLELSERRAQAVRDYLVGKGVASQRFTVRGLGPDRPVATNGSAEGRANNRRVEIVIPPPAVGMGKETPSATPGELGPTTTPPPRPATTTPPPGTFPSPGTPGSPLSPTTPTSPNTPPLPPSPGSTPPAPGLPPPPSSPGPTPPAPDLPPSPSPNATPPTPDVPGNPGPTPPRRGGSSQRPGTPPPVPPGTSR